MSAISICLCMLTIYFNITELKAGQTIEPITSLTFPITLISTTLLSYFGIEYEWYSISEFKWIPNDPRRHTADPCSFYVHIDTTQLPSNMENKELAIGAIKNAVKTWDNVPCSQGKFNLKISDEYDGKDLGYFEYVLNGGDPKSGKHIHDIVFGGFVPFDELLLQIETEPVEYVPTTAVTLIWSFEEESAEIAFAEIYFNDNYKWGILDENDDTSHLNGRNGTYDIETVALHELGHALSVDHFHGGIQKLKTIDHTGQQILNDKVNIQKRQEINMAPVYFGVSHDLHGADKGQLCQQWTHWKCLNSNFEDEFVWPNQSLSLIVVLSFCGGCAIFTIIAAIWAILFKNSKKSDYSHVQSCDVIPCQVS